MGTLSRYSSLEEKKKNFSVIQIDTKYQFEAFYETISLSDSIWRGVPDARHKLYTSLQRFWITHDLSKTGEDVFDYLEHIQIETEKWQSKFIQKYYQNMAGRAPSLFSILSMLRHYGAPSPLSDWTRNPQVALFFALNNNPVTHDDDSLNYCSVYEIPKSFTWIIPDLKFFITNLLDGVFQSEDVAAKDILKKLGNEKLVSSEIGLTEKAHALVNNLNHLKHSYNDKSLNQVIIIEDLTNDPFAWDINNNYNIINQQGLFLLNLDPITPLDEVYEKNMLLAYKENRLGGLSWEEFNKTLTREKAKLKCYNIHKSLQWYVQKRLKENTPSICTDFLFPDMYKLAQHVQVTFLEKESKYDLPFF